MKEIITGNGTNRPQPGAAERDLKLSNGSRVGVIGGGPSGSFFAFFLLNMARSASLNIHVDIYEPRNYLKPGPTGCNMCAGIVSETLVQNLASEGINLPGPVVQRGIDSYILHMDVGSVRIDTPLDEKRIGAVYRGAGPRDLKGVPYAGLDGHLLNLALENGAHLINDRVSQIELAEDGRPMLGTRSSELQVYDLVSVTAGINSPLVKKFAPLGLDYAPPETTKTYLREYYLGKEQVTKLLGNSIQVFLLEIPRLEFGMLIPKDEYMTVCLLGEDIDKELVAAFMDAPEVQRVLPPELIGENFSCHCSPRINTEGAQHPYGDHLVFIGDCSSTRLFKDGIGSAYRAAKAAASTAVFQGISAGDFEAHYLPFCRDVDYDNDIGRVIFMVVSQIQKRRFARKAVLKMIVDEQGRPGSLRPMSTVQWDMYTGSGSYKEIFMRTLKPSFLLRLGRDIFASLFSRTKTLSVSDIQNQHPENRLEKSSGALGRRYEPGEVLIQQGDCGEEMFVIQDGQVAIIREQKGEEVFLGMRGPGDILGEMALFDQELRSATVKAVSEVTAITVDRQNFNKRIHEDPSMAYRLFQIMSDRTRNLNDQVAALNKELDRVTEPVRD